MTVEFLPPVVPTEEEKQDAHKFAARVRSVMAEASGLPQTEHALADFFLMKSAQKFGTQPANQTKPPAHPAVLPLPCLAYAVHRIQS